MPPVDTPAPDVVRRRPLLVFGPFTFDRTSRRLRRGDTEIALPPRVLGVLELLLTRADDVVARQELIDAVWKDAFVTDTSLAEAVSFLRQALGDDPQAPTFIQTVHRRGYRFLAPVSEAPSVTGRTASPPSVSDTAPEPGTPLYPSIGGHLVPWSLAVLCAVLALAALWRLASLRPVSPPVVRLRLDPAPGTNFDVRAPAFVLSPDGTRAAWSACDTTGCRLYLRALDQIQPVQVTGTDDASAPFFSPDGRWIGFFAGGKIMKVAVAGGSPVTVTDAPQTFGAAWLPNGWIVFSSSPRGGLMRVSERGGQAVALTVPSARNGEFGHAWPAPLAGGALLFTITAGPAPGSTGRIAALQIDRADRSARWTVILEPGDLARAVTGDYVAYSRGGEIHAVPIDRVRLLTAGAGQAVETGILPASFSVSNAGALGYVAQVGTATAPNLAWMGGATVAASAGSLNYPALSPDGSRIAGTRSDQAASDIWIADVERGVTTRLTFGGTNIAPIWRGDGRGIYFAAANGGAYEIWQRDAAGSARPARVLATSGDRHLLPTSTSRDGRILAYVQSGGETRGDIWIVREGSAPEAIIDGPFDEAGGMLSPDGTMLAYQSDESGRWEISLMRLRDRHRLPLSAGGGTAPQWSTDGRAVYFVAGTELMKAEVDPSGDRAATPVSVGTLTAERPAGIAPDGRILVHRANAPTPGHAVLTLEWAQELRQKLGPPVTTLPR